MSFLKLSGMMIGILGFALPAFAGAISGGGGRAIVCRDTNKKIISAELLDLYEGRVQYGYQIPTTNVPYVSQYHEALKNISKGRPGFDYSGYADYVNQLMRLLPDGTGLIPIDDSEEVIIPKNCKTEQLANYNDNQETLLVDGEIFENLSETNKAALISHETIYSILRKMGDTNSIMARQMVAVAFSGTKFIDYQSGLPSTALQCNSYDSKDSISTQFWMFNDQDGNLEIQFDRIAKKPASGQVASKTTIGFYKIDMNDASEMQSAGPLWAGSESVLPAQTVSIQFVPAPVGDEKNIHGMIGLGSMPNMPDTHFVCFRHPIN